MSLMPIIEVPDALLRTKSAPIEDVTTDLERLIADMFETMYEAPGIGLAAIQVAVPRRLVIIDLQDPEEEGGEPVKRPMSSSTPKSSTDQLSGKSITKAAFQSPTNMPRSSAPTSFARDGSMRKAGLRKASSTD
jgi:peptide deformylase